MREAFTYMFKDTRFSEKAMIYFLISFVYLVLISSQEVTKMNATANMPSIVPVTNPLLLILPLIGTILMVILNGYYFTCVQAIIKQNQNYLLPFFKFRSSFLKGLKFNISVFLFTLAFALIFALISFFNKTFGIIITFFFAILIAININAFYWIYAYEGKLSTMFAWKKAINLVYKNFKLYFKNWALLIILLIAGIIVTMLFMLIFNFWLNSIYIAWVLTSLVSAFVLSYTGFVSMYLVAKSIEPKSVV